MLLSFPFMDICSNFTKALFCVSRRESISNLFVQNISSVLIRLNALSFRVFFFLCKSWFKNKSSQTSRHCPNLEGIQHLCLKIKSKEKSEFDLTVVGSVLSLRMFFCLSPCFLSSFNAISHHFFLSFFTSTLILPYGVLKYLIGFHKSVKETRLFDGRTECPVPPPIPRGRARNHVNRRILDALPWRPHPDGPPLCSSL